MTSLRAWIAVLAAIAFLAGLAGGLLAGELRHRASPPREPFDDYTALLAGHLHLDPERERLLRQLLRNYEMDVQRVQGRHSAELLAAMEPELRELGERYRNLIRSRLLDGERREAYDELARSNQRILSE